MYSEPPQIPELCKSALNERWRPRWVELLIKLDVEGQVHESTTLHTKESKIFVSKDAHARRPMVVITHELQP